MRKALLVLITAFSASGAMAADVNASIYRIDMNLKLYEVCGSVTGMTSPGNLAVEIEVDPGKHAGHYVTHTNVDGKFCQIVRVVGNSINIKVDSQLLTLNVVK